MIIKSIYLFPQTGNFTFTQTITTNEMKYEKYEKEIAVHKVKKKSRP